MCATKWIVNLYESDLDYGIVIIVAMNQEVRINIDFGLLRTNLSTFISLHVKALFRVRSETEMSFSDVYVILINLIVQVFGVTNENIF